MNQLSFLGAIRSISARAKIKGGAQAVKSGKAAESAVYQILAPHGYDIETQVTLTKNIYGHMSRVDFVVHGVPEFPDGLIIESKWQDGPGTADEKYPFLVENIRHCYPYPTIVVLAGGGYRPGSEEWLRKQVDGKKFYAVFSLEEFLKWTIRNL